MILTYEDFTNELALPKDQYSELQNFINQYEADYAVKILGAQLFEEYIANPNELRFDKIFYPFNENNNVCNGVKKTLAGFIYFHYVRELQQQLTLVGSVATKSELSERASANNKLVRTYNEAIRNTKMIDCFIRETNDKTDLLQVSQTELTNAQFAQMQLQATTTVSFSYDGFSEAELLPAKKYNSFYQLSILIKQALQNNFTELTAVNQKSDNKIKFYLQSLQGATSLPQNLVLKFTYGASELEINFDAWANFDYQYSSFKGCRSFDFISIL